VNPTRVWPTAPSSRSRTCISPFLIALSIAFSFGLLLVSPPSAATGARASRNAQRQPLGSLSAIGQVYVNDAPAPSESTVFPGDVVRTTESSAATFSMSGKGVFKIAPQTVVFFAGEPRYVAELRSGTVVMTSFAGATDITMKVSNFVVAPVVQAERSTTKIERESDGSYMITCVDGSVGLIPLQGTAGRVLGPGQSVVISSNGELNLGESPAGAAPPTIPANTNPPVQKSKRKEWIILGLLGGGAAIGAAAAAASSSGGSKPVSPSSP
jgi:hypothetical protein